MNRKRKMPVFMNSRDIGKYADICFEICGETEHGQECIRFDTRVHYFEKGKGPILLLIHGIGQSLYTWQQNIDYFVENGFRVIALDLPGFGYSGHPVIYYTVEEYALIIKTFMDALHIKNAHIAAFSTGCLSAVYLAVQHPERVRRLVFISPGGPGEHYPFAIRMMTTKIGHMLARIFITETAVQRILHELFFDATMVTDEMVEGYFAPYKDKEVRDTLAVALTHFDDTEARKMLKSVKQKTLVFTGIDDKIHIPDMTRVYYTMPQNAEHISLRNCGHLVHEEKSDRFNSETLAFLTADDVVERE